MDNHGLRPWFLFPKCLLLYNNYGIIKISRLEVEGGEFIDSSGLGKIRGRGCDAELVRSSRHERRCSSSEVPPIPRRTSGSVRTRVRPRRRVVVGGRWLLSQGRQLCEASHGTEKPRNSTRPHPRREYNWGCNTLPHPMG